MNESTVMFKHTKKLSKKLDSSYQTETSTLSDSSKSSNSFISDSDWKSGLEKYTILFVLSSIVMSKIISRKRKNKFNRVTT